MRERPPTLGERVEMVFDDINEQTWLIILRNEHHLGRLNGIFASLFNLPNAFPIAQSHATTEVSYNNIDETN
jgi:hypothetical protein